MDNLEYRFSPVKIDGRVLSGTVMRYGEIATGAPRPEKFLPGAFKVPPDGVILNVQHDRNKPDCQDSRYSDFDRYGRVPGIARYGPRNRRRH